MSTFFVPIEITDLNMTSSVGIDSDADIYGAAWKGVWSAAYAGGYSTGNVVRKNNNLYESQIDANTEDPVTGSVSETPTWIDLQMINKYRMFDDLVGANPLYQNKGVTSDTDEIIVTISGAIDEIAFFDLNCVTVLAEIIDSDSTTLWQQEYNLIDGLRDVGSYVEYFFKPFPSYNRDIDIHLGWTTSTALGESVRLTLRGVGTVSCGNCFLGSSIEIGETKWGVSAGVLYYGEITTDRYGRTTHIPGVSAKTHDVDIYINLGEESRVYRILKDILSKDVVFNLNNDGVYDHIITYGYIGDFNEPMEQLGTTIVNMEIIGRI